MSNTNEFSAEVVALHSAIARAYLDRSAIQAEKNNISGAKKLASYAKNFRIEYAAVMQANAIQAEPIIKLAQYAFVKAAQICASVSANANKLDKYTHAILVNALALKSDTISNKLQNASACRDLETDKTLKVRLQKGSSTADTQTSSTRQALAALNVATYSEAEHSMTFNKESEIYKALVRILKKESNK